MPAFGLLEIALRPLAIQATGPLNDVLKGVHRQAMASSTDWTRVGQSCACAATSSSLSLVWCIVSDTWSVSFLNPVKATKNISINRARY
jgi:hypothetical protein